ncbi:Uma2 family endonuclease [Kineococcus xinjiangensis]|uniref:Uma2 family endonuclease n=1 Tax=Kineococcus xinjiangensis TaxID=512762 RepID=A0A2S6ID69_9ACTN|nr:Uma2 family endonuclease [Kineococcus xinjiangensis]PPK92147.1 Uma2 family endonuclease [Kineococcus xinjiangensis]
MSVKPAHESWTFDDLERLPDDGRRYEIVDGVLVATPAPTVEHQIIATNLMLALALHLDPGVREVHGAGVRVPADLGRAEHYLIPDVLVVRRGATSGQLDARDVVLAVEVVSRSSRTHDRHTKHGLYAELGISEYWIADPAEDTLTVHELHGGEYRVPERVSGAETLQRLAVSMASLRA